MAGKRTKRTTKKRSAPDWGPRCLKALAKMGNITEACKAAGIGRTAFYARRDSDADFAQAVADALDTACDGLESEAWKRARDNSDTLLIFLLKSNRPEKYRERHEVKHTGQVRVTVSAEELSDDELAAIARTKPS